MVNEIDRADPLDREINGRVGWMAVAEQVEAAAIGDERVRIEIVMVALAGQTCVVNLEPALIEQRTQDYVELFAEVGVVLGCIRNGVKLALEGGQASLLRYAQILRHLLPHALDTFLQHRAFEELENSQREIQQRDLVRGGLRGVHPTDQAEF